MGIVTLEITPSSPDIPPELWQFSPPPEKLWVRGHHRAFALLERLPGDGLAVVGTRHPQARSRAVLRTWIRELSDSGLVIISGFARGIDAVAHEAALEARLPTIAIMATGLDRLYPSVHAELAEKVLASGGLLVSESELLEPGRPHLFLQRNRIIAAWSRATWVVEAPARSGSLNTAMWAREFDRPCYAVPSFPGDPAMEGNQKLLDRDHAIPFWGIHSLGQTWLKLATHRPSSRGRATPTPPRNDAEMVVSTARNLCLQAGGAPFPSLLGAALERGWEPARFFIALRQAIDSGELHDEGGSFLPRSPSDGRHQAATPAVLEDI